MKIMIKKFKEKLIELDKHYLICGVIKILEDSKYGGFYTKVSSDYPDSFFHIAENGIVKAVDEKRNMLVKNTAAAALFTILLNA